MAKTCAKSVLQSITTVKDVNPQTNNTSIEHQLTGGVTDEILLGFGVRALLSSSRMTAAAEQARADLEQTLSETGDVFLRLVGEAGLDALDVMLANGRITVAEYERQKRQIAALVLESDAYRNAMARAGDIAAREGFFLEVAAGFVWDFAGGTWQSRAFRKRGVWATPSYEFGFGNVLGVLRYLDETEAPDREAFDWGGRAIYSSADYALSFEYVQRSPLQQGPLQLLANSQVPNPTVFASWVLGFLGFGVVQVTGRRGTAGAAAAGCRCHAACAADTSPASVPWCRRGSTGGGRAVRTQTHLRRCRRRPRK